VAHEPSWIELEGACNVRDLGGLPARGGVTRAGVLHRSDALDALTDADVQALVHRIGLAHVVDLRSPDEQAERGRGRLGAAGLVYSELALIDDDDVVRRRNMRAMAFAAGEDPEAIMALSYVELLERSGDRLVSALERVTMPGGSPVLVHCAAGKDRTGVLVALLLDAAGVDRDVIVADYAATQQRMPAIMARLTTAAAYQDLATDVPAFVFEARAGTMRRFLAILSDRWGGAHGYFVEAGADRTTLSRWQELFVSTRNSVAAE
jgi:protein-tyrosine phosphatase